MGNPAQITYRESKLSISSKRPSEPSNSRLRFAEFFAGIGLVGLALRELGWNCVYANDIDKKKFEMYSDYFDNGDHYHVEDVHRTSEIIKRIPGILDLATVSFPCVDLSLAGNRKGLAGKQSGAFLGFLTVLESLAEEARLPRVLLIENVIGFLTSREGRDFETAALRLSRLGYSLDAFVVDAKHFVPQSRPRLFIIACLDSELPSHVLRHQSAAPTPQRPATLLAAIKKSRAKSWIRFPLPELPMRRKLLTSIIDTDAKQEWWDEARIKKHLAEMHPSHLSRLRQLSECPGQNVATIYRRVRNGKACSELRTDGIAGCLRTPRGGSSKQIVVVAGAGKVRMRWMSAREYARLQGAETFPITVDYIQALFGFGDAVCVPVISWIARNVLSQIFDCGAAARA